MYKTVASVFRSQGHTLTLVKDEDRSRFNFYDAINCRKDALSKGQ